MEVCTRKRNWATSVALLAAILAALCVVPAQARAAWDDISYYDKKYVVRGWDGTQVTAEEKMCYEYQRLEDRTESNSPVRVASATKRWTHSIFTRIALAMRDLAVTCNA